MVSGVTIVATCMSRRRPSRAPTFAKPLIICQPQSAVPQLRLEDSILLAQVPYCLRLFALEPTQERRNDQLR
jgi:hypothetical protein